MWWVVGRVLAFASGTTSVIVLAAAAVVVCDRATERRERREMQVEADRVIRNERDAAVLERNEAARRALRAECEVLTLRLQLDEIRRNGVLFPRRPDDVPAADLIPVQALPIPIRAEK